MKNFISAFVLISLLLTNCSKENTKLSQTIEAKTFTLNTPHGWKLIPEQGIDTYIGRITDERSTIYFDQGYLSFGGLENVEEHDLTVFFIKTTINGVPAIIHKENRADDSSARTRLSVYLDNGEKQNILYVLDSDNDGFFVSIFKTHRFL